MDNERHDSDRAQDRIDLNRAVELRFDRFQDFLTEIAGNISPGGMFVKTHSPHEPGERFEFACSLADGFPLVCGRGEVVWVREAPGSEDRPAGMGVRFLELFENSGELIAKIIENRQKEG
ncbi:MAG: TIGR02266 family protein, partial [Thermoanaerobaculia bacterium]